MERSAEATWQGKLKDGKGWMKGASGAFEGSYSFATRFGDDRGTNPEELLGAAHASCYAMALAATLEKAGFPAARVHTTAKVRVVPKGGGFEIDHIHVRASGLVPGMGADAFKQAALQAFASCPLTQVLEGGTAKLEHEAVLLGRADAGAETQAE